MKQGEQISRHFYGCMTDRIAGNQTGISILLESTIINLFHRTIFIAKGCFRGISRLFCNGKRSGHVCKNSILGYGRVLPYNRKYDCDVMASGKIRPAHSIFVHRENGWQCIFSGGKDRILFADCGCGRDKKTQNSLKNADVIVAGIHTYPSEWQEIIHNFTVRHKKVLYLVEGYALHASRLKTDMMDRYRIAPEQIGYIPQNGELEWVSAQGKIDNFMKSWRQKSRTERNENFFEEMEHNLFLLMKQMEKNENGGYQLWNR